MEDLKHVVSLYTWIVRIEAREIKNCSLEEWREWESAPAYGKRMTHRVKRGTETKRDSGEPRARESGRRWYPFAHAVLFPCPIQVGEGQRGGCRWTAAWARQPLSVIGNLYFCRPYLSFALTPCFCTEWIATNGSSRSSRSSDTRGLSWAGHFQSVSSSQNSLAMGFCWWLRHRHHRRFQSNLQCRVLRVSFASPRGCRIATLSRITLRFRMSVSRALYIPDRSHRECYSSQTRSRDCSFYRHS